jgi:hypothetical protein
VRVLVSSRSALAFAEPLSATPLPTSLDLYLLSSPLSLILDDNPISQPLSKLHQYN